MCVTRRETLAGRPWGEGALSDAHSAAPSGLGHNRERTVGMRKPGTRRAGLCRH